jgi:hypothetical protein
LYVIFFQRPTHNEAPTTQGTVIPNRVRSGVKEGEVLNKTLFRSLERNVKASIQKRSQKRRNIFKLSKPKYPMHYSK